MEKLSEAINTNLGFNLATVTKNQLRSLLKEKGWRHKAMAKRSRTILHRDPTQELINFTLTVGFALREGHPIVFFDESSMNSSSYKAKSWAGPNERATSLMLPQRFSFSLLLAISTRGL